MIRYCLLLCLKVNTSTVLYENLLSVKQRKQSIIWRENFPINQIARRSFSRSTSKTCLIHYFSELIYLINNVSVKLYVCFQIIQLDGQLIRLAFAASVPNIFIYTFIDVRVGDYKYINKYYFRSSRSFETKNMILTEIFSS